MTALIPGTLLKITGGETIDSIIPVNLTSTQILAPGVHQIVTCDPSGGSFTVTLPAAASNPGVFFHIKRTANGTNVLTIAAAGADKIDDTAVDYKLSLAHEYLTVFSDGTTSWRIISKDIFSIATMTASNKTFTVSTALLKYDTWDTEVFSTPQKLVVDLINDQIDIPEFQGPIADGYSVNVTFDFEYTNNNTVTAQLYINGALTGIPVSVNALGTGKPTFIAITQQVAVLAVTSLELHIKAEGAGTITAINALMQIQRIGR